MRSVFDKVEQGAALHVHERFLARRMHDFQHITLGIGHAEKEIVIVFAGQRMDGGFQTVKRTRNSRSNLGGYRRSDASFRHHAEIVLAGMYLSKRRC